MLLATTPAGFADGHPELQRLVLNREAIELPERYRLYLTLFNANATRETGTYHPIDLQGGAFSPIEISYPPSATC